MWFNFESTLATQLYIASRIKYFNYVASVDWKIYVVLRMRKSNLLLMHQAMLTSVYKLTRWVYIDMTFWLPNTTYKVINLIIINKW